MNKMEMPQPQRGVKDEAVLSGLIILLATPISSGGALDTPIVLVPCG